MNLKNKFGNIHKEMSLLTSKRKNADRNVPGLCYGYIKIARDTRQSLGDMSPATVASGVVT